MYGFFGKNSTREQLTRLRRTTLDRAATTLRSIETQPFDWMICLVS